MRAQVVERWFTLRGSHVNLETYRVLLVPVLILVPGKSFMRNLQGRRQFSQICLLLREKDEWKLKIFEDWSQFDLPMNGLGSLPESSSNAREDPGSTIDLAIDNNRRAVPSLGDGALVSPSYVSWPIARFLILLRFALCPSNRQHPLDFAITHFANYWGCFNEIQIITSFCIV